MGKFDLEANPDGIVPLFTGDVKDEATAREKDISIEQRSCCKDHEG